MVAEKEEEAEEDKHETCMQSRQNVREEKEGSNDCLRCILLLCSVPPSKNNTLQVSGRGAKRSRGIFRLQKHVFFMTLPYYDGSLEKTEIS